MSDPRDVVIVDGIRTPFAKAGTKLKDVHAADLGRTCVTELMNRTGIEPGDVDEVIIGNTGNPPDAVNISRVVALRSGIPQEVPAHTVHRNCASALESICTGFDKIKAGMADVVVAGGTESMSQMPLLFSRAYTKRFEALSRARTPGAQIQGLLGVLGAGVNQVKELATTPPLKKTPFKPVISIMEGLTDPFKGINMGQTAEILAKEFGISRETQDEYAMRSHNRAVQAQKNGHLADEIHPVFLPPKYKSIVEEDVGPRDGQSMESLGKLKPFFDRKYGTITVGNACPITDGAASVMLMSRERANSLGLKPRVSIKSYAFAGLEPERMGLGPVFATPKALKRAGGMSLQDMDFVELNEAFAAQVLACNMAFASKDFCQDRLGLSDAMGEVDPDKLNVNGGAIALGHPVGATGTRLVITLMNQMERANKEFGLATLCIGGGQGGAIVLQKEA